MNAMVVFLILILGSRGYMLLNHFPGVIMAGVLIFLFVIFGSFTAQAGSADNTLTLDETLRRVWQENPTLQAGREEFKAVQELYPQAMAGWHPNLNAETSITSTDIESGNFANGDGATTKSGSINIEQPIFRGFRTTGERDAAKRRIDSAHANQKMMEQDVFLRTVEAYVNVIRDRQLLDLQQKNKGLLTKEKEAVQARFEAGDITQTDVRQTEARYSNALADEAVAESRLKASEAEFEEVTGISPPEYMEMPVIGFVFPQTAAELVSMAGNQNPELTRSRHDHEAAQSDIKIVESGFYPQVAAFASYIKEYDPQPGIIDESETSTIGIRARINLYEGGKNISQRREAKFRTNKRLIEIREAEMAVKGDLISNWRRYQAYDAEIAARELEITAAKFSAEGVREEANMGDRTILDMLEAEQEVLDAQSNLVEAKRGRILSAYRLAAALGLLIPERLGFTE